MATAIQNQRKANAETERSNKESERLTKESQKIASARDAEQARHNKAVERETKRSNKASEARADKQLQIQKQQMIGQAVGNTVGGLATGAMLLFNDWQWYAKSEKMADTLLNLPSHEALGTQYPLTADYNTKPRYSGSSVYAQYYAPSIGISHDASSGVNRAAEQLWTEINERNGRNSSYAAADLMMEQIGVAGLLAFEALLERAYEWAGVYSGSDATLPRGILEAMGFNAADIRKHRYQLCNLINDLRAFISVYRLSPRFQLANRWYFLNRLVFCDDSDGERVQWYCHVPTHFPRLSVLGDVTKIVCENWVTTSSGKVRPKLHTFDEVFDITQTMMNEFIVAQDVKIMNADLVAHFGEEATKPFGNAELFQLDAKPTISTDKNALYQFRNAVIFPALRYQEGTADNRYGISEGTYSSGAAQIPYVTANGGWGTDDPGESAGRYTSLEQGFLVETITNNPSAVEFIEVTRCIPAHVFGSDSFYTEVPQAIGVTALRYNTEGRLYFTRSYLDDSGLQLESDGSITPSDNMDYDLLTLLKITTNFKYGMLFVVNAPAEGTVPSVITSNWENTAWVPADLLNAANKRIALHVLGGNQ